MNVKKKKKTKIKVVTNTRNSSNTTQSNFNKIEKIHNNPAYPEEEAVTTNAKKL